MPNSLSLTGRIKLTMAQGGRADPSCYMAGWRAGTTTLCHSQLNPTVTDYEFDFRYLRLGCELRRMQILLPPTRYTYLKDTYVQLNIPNAQVRRVRKIDRKTGSSFIDLSQFKLCGEGTEYFFSLSRDAIIMSQIDVL